jgi:hypothetical protein
MKTKISAPKTSTIKDDLAFDRITSSIDLQLLLKGRCSR